jgi:hypothetical protein
LELESATIGSDRHAVFLVEGMGQCTKRNGTGNCRCVAPWFYSGIGLLPLGVVLR